jgi:hypothetical protein
MHELIRRATPERVLRRLRSIRDVARDRREPRRRRDRVDISHRRLLISFCMAEDDLDIEMGRPAEPTGARPHGDGGSHLELGGTPARSVGARVR